jgi:UDP-glucose 4-epimerase
VTTHVTTHVTTDVTNAPMATAYANVDALVIGATGFIGRWVATALVQAGARVTCAVRDVDAMARLAERHRLHVTIAPVDLTNPRGVAELFAAHPATITFNLAGYGIDRAEVDERLAQRINADLVRELVTYCRAANAPPSWRGHRLVHVGSALEYGPIGGALPETAVAHPDTLYGRTKLAGTAYTIGQTGAMTARVFTVYGPGEHAGRLLPTLLAARFSDTPIALSAGTQSRDFTYVEDVADGLLRLGAAADLSDRPVNMATGVLTTVRAFAETAASVAGIAAERLTFGARAGYADETPHGQVSLARMRDAIGWAPPTGIAAGIARTIAADSAPSPSSYLSP